MYTLKTWTMMNLGSFCPMRLAHFPLLCQVLLRFNHHASCLPRCQTPSSQNSAEPSEASEQQSSGTYFFSDISYRVATFACNHLGYRDKDTFGIRIQG